MSHARCFVFCILFLDLDGDEYAKRYAQTTVENTEDKPPATHILINRTSFFLFALLSVYQHLSLTDIDMHVEAALF